MKTDYLKFVRWSDEDKVFIGYCPDLFLGGACHGKDENKVYAELSRLVGRGHRPAPPRQAAAAAQRHDRRPPCRGLKSPRSQTPLGTHLSPQRRCPKLPLRAFRASVRTALNFPSLFPPLLSPLPSSVRNP